MASTETSARLPSTFFMLFSLLSMVTAGMAGCVEARRSAGKYRNREPGHQELASVGSRRLGRGGIGPDGEIPVQGVVQRLGGVAGVDHHHNLVIGRVQLRQTGGTVIQQAERDQPRSLLRAGVEEAEAALDVLRGLQPEQWAFLAHPEQLQHLIPGVADRRRSGRSEEHTSELQSRPHLVCRLLLEKKKRL